MADLDYLNSAEGARRLRGCFEPAFHERMERLVADATLRGVRPAPAEILRALDCTRDELAAVFAIMSEKARSDGTPLDLAVFGIEVDVTAVLHHDRAAGVTHWIFKPWSKEGLMLA